MNYKNILILQIDSAYFHISEVNLKDLMLAMKEKQFNSVRKWAVDNIDNDRKGFRRIYDVASVCPTVFYSSINFNSRLSIQICICADQELNLVACLWK